MRNLADGFEPEVPGVLTSRDLARLTPYIVRRDARRAADARLRIDALTRRHVLRSTPYTPEWYVAREG